MLETISALNHLAEEADITEVGASHSILRVIGA